MPDTSLQTCGLTIEDARQRLASHGPNALAARDQESLLEGLLKSLGESLVLPLLAIGVLYLVFGELRDALIIFGVIVTVALTEATIEWRAGRTVAALSAIPARVAALCALGAALVPLWLAAAGSDRPSPRRDQEGLAS